MSTESTSDEPVLDACVVGAGITGLVIAHRLAAHGWRVSVLEKGGAAGGVMRTADIDGFLFDQGPNTVLARSGGFDAVVVAVGIADQVVVADERAANRFVVKGGCLRRLPATPGAFVRSDVLSWQGKLRALAEPLIPTRRSRDGESVADFVRRRLGGEVLDYLVDPFVAGVYAGDPEAMDLASALPRLAALESDHGGLIRGALALKRARARARTRTRAPARPEAAGSESAEDGSSGTPLRLSTGPTGSLQSFDRGLQVLPAALAASLGPSLVTEAEVTAIRPAGEGVASVAWRRAGGAAGAEKRALAKRVVVTSPAAASAEMLKEVDGSLSTALRAIPYAPVAVVFHGYPRASVADPLDGFGFLAPKLENRRILGTLWNSSIFPGRAPEGHVALTTFVGGARQPDLAALSEARLFEIVEAELRELIGVRGTPTVRSAVAWPRAIPQYERRHPDAQAAMDRFEAEHPAIRLAGSFRRGVSVADCVEQGLAVADELLRMEAAIDA